MALPKNALTHIQIISGDSSTTFETSTPTTIIGFFSAVERSSEEVFIKCGSDIVYSNVRNTAGAFIEANVVCNENLSIETMGNGDFYSLINYVKYDRTSSTIEDIDIELDVNLMNQFVPLPTSSVQYALVYGSASLVWLLFLISFAVMFFWAVNWYRKVIKREKTQK